MTAEENLLNRYHKMNEKDSFCEFEMTLIKHLDVFERLVNELQSLSQLKEY